jgi:hypothetical protein
MMRMTMYVAVWARDHMVSSATTARSPGNLTRVEKSRRANPRCSLVFQRSVFARVPLWDEMGSKAACVRSSEKVYLWVANAPDDGTINPASSETR